MKTLVQHSSRLPVAGDALVVGYSKTKYTVESVKDGLVYYGTYARRDNTLISMPVRSLRLLDNNWLGVVCWVEEHVRNFNFNVTFKTVDGLKTFTSFAPSMAKAAANVVHRLGGDLQKANGKVPISVNSVAIAHKYLADAAGQPAFTNNLLTVTFE